jgi:hypothetical protein
MPFEVLETETKHNRPLMAAISYMRPTRRGKGEPKKGVKPQLLISIPTALSAIGKKKFFVLQIGRGPDKGNARIAGQNAKSKATVEPKCLKFTQIFNFGFVPMLGEDIAGLEHIPVRKINDDEFEVDLPAWFKSEGLR